MQEHARRAKRDDVTMVLFLERDKECADQVTTPRDRTDLTLEAYGKRSLALRHAVQRVAHRS